tara:strand:- start:2261 stop:2368 length:108 start_codon:yes stop_codon:yes gene_type:complete
MLKKEINKNETLEMKMNSVMRKVEFIAKGIWENKP